MAYLEKRGGYYSIRFRDGGRIARRISINTLAGFQITRRTQAQQVFERWLALRGSRFAPVVPGTLTELLCRYRQYAQQHFTAETYRSEVRRITEFVSWCGDLGITRADHVTASLIEDFKLQRRRRCGPVTVNRFLERIRAFFNYAVTLRFVTESPYRGIRMLPVHEQEPRCLTHEEIARLLAAISGDFRDGVIVALQTGCRESELVGIKLADCRPDGIHLLKTKSYKPRTVPYGPEVLAMVERRRANSQIFGVHLFDNGRGQPLWSAANWYARIKAAYRQAHIEHATFHSLRHTFATRLIRAGVNIKVVNTLMGHADLKTTMRYLHLEQGDKERAVQKLLLPL